MLEADTVTLPEHWASYLVNGDASGLEGEEKRHADYAIEQLGEWYVVDVARDESGEGIEARFTWNYRLYDTLAGCDGGSILDYVVHRSV